VTICSTREAFCSRRSDHGLFRPSTNVRSELRNLGHMQFVIILPAIEFLKIIGSMNHGFMKSVEINSIDRNCCRAKINLWYRKLPQNNDQNLFPDNSWYLRPTTLLGVFWEFHSELSLHSDPVKWPQNSESFWTGLFESASLNGNFSRQRESIFLLKHGEAKGPRCFSKGPDNEWSGQILWCSESINARHAWLLLRKIRDNINPSTPGPIYLHIWFHAIE
jgi:hypothetical protein